MNRAIAWFAENHVAANLLMLLIILAGLMSSIGLRQELLPEIELQFSDTMNRLITESSASLSRGGIEQTDVAFQWDSDSSLLTVTPAAELYADNPYVLRVGKQAESAIGYRLLSDFELHFIAREIDVIAPYVLACDPAVGATFVPVDSGITVFFSEEMNQTTVGETDTGRGIGGFLLFALVVAVLAGFYRIRPHRKIPYFWPVLLVVLAILMGAVYEAHLLLIAGFALAVAWAVIELRERRALP